MKIRKILGWPLAAALVIGAGSNLLAQAQTFSGAARVIDGDSLHVGDTEVRLFGVDAFEGRQTCTRNGAAWACGEAAADKLRSLASGRTISCKKKDTDSYGRTVAVCSNGTADLGAEIARRARARVSAIRQRLRGRGRRSEGGAPRRLGRRVHGTVGRAARRKRVNHAAPR